MVIDYRNSYPWLLYQEVPLVNNGISIKGDFLKQLKIGYDYRILNIIASVPSNAAKTDLAPEVEFTLIQAEKNEREITERIPLSLITSPALSETTNRARPFVGRARVDYLISNRSFIDIRVSGAVNTEPKTVRILILGRNEKTQMAGVGV